MPEQPIPTRTPAVPDRRRAGRPAAAAAVAAHALLVLGVVPAMAQTSSPTSSTPAGQGPGGRMNGPFIVVAVIAGLLLFLFQRRTFRKMQDMFDPDRDRPQPPDGPGPWDRREPPDGPRPRDRREPPSEPHPRDRREPPGGPGPRPLP